MDPLVDEFYSRGYTVLRNVLSADTVASFLGDVSADISSLENAESGNAFKQPIRLDAPETWPSGRLRRVAECAPVGNRPHWQDLIGSEALSSALNGIMGDGAWHIPLNTAGDDGKLIGPRYWYAPVVFPEQDVASQDIGKDSSTTQLPSPTSAIDSRFSADDSEAFISTGIDAAFSDCPGPRRALFVSSFDEVAMNGPISEETAHKRWQPVSRRRWLNKGWHIDIGPGFPNDGIRSVRGDPHQGVVLLLLLTDWLPGGGGTAMIPYSHFWPLRELQRVAGTNTSLAHEQLNRHFVDVLRTVTEAGRVVLHCCCQNGSHHSAEAAAAVAAPCPAADNCKRLSDIPSSQRRLPNDIEGCCEPILVEQVVGKVGDIVLMHPLLLHSGTANMRRAYRVMMNGMVNVRQEAFERDGGCAVFLRTADSMRALIEEAAQ